MVRRSVWCLINPKCWFDVDVQGVCKPCHPSCLTCRGEGIKDCFQCASGYERVNDDDTDEGLSGGGKCEKTMLWDLLDPSVMKHLAWAIILCIGAIIICSLAFAVLQARHRRKLCWATKHPNYAPDWTKGAYDGISSTLEDSEGGGGGDKRTSQPARREDYTAVLGGVSPSLFKAVASPSPPSSLPPPPPPHNCRSLPTLMGNFRLNSYAKPGFLGAAYPTPTPHDPKAWLHPSPPPSMDCRENPLYTHTYDK